MATEDLTLIERPCLEVPREISGDAILAAGSLPLSTSVVVGLVLRERPPLILRGYDQTGDETRRQLPLTKSRARRWAEFFSVHMASKADHEHDGEAIARYVLGMEIATMHDPQRWIPIEYKEDADIHQPALDGGYAIMNEQEQAKYFVHGIDDPQLCLSTLGMGQPLIVAPIRELMPLFDGHHLREITPTSHPTKYRF